MKAMKTEEFDKKFDRGESVIEHLDIEKTRRPNLETKRVNVDFPQWVIEALNREARRLGVTRQALIKVWIAERLLLSSQHKSPDRHHDGVS